MSGNQEPTGCRHSFSCNVSFWFVCQAIRNLRVVDTFFNKFTDHFNFLCQAIRNLRVVDTICPKKNLSFSLCQAIRNLRVVDTNYCFHNFFFKYVRQSGTYGLQTQKIVFFIELYFMSGNQEPTGCRHSNTLFKLNIKIMSGNQEPTGCRHFFPLILYYIVYYVRQSGTYGLQTRNLFFLLIFHKICQAIRNLRVVDTFSSYFLVFKLLCQAIRNLRVVDTILISSFFFIIKMSGNQEPTGCRHKNIIFFIFCILCQAIRNLRVVDTIIRT